MMPTSPANDSPSRHVTVVDVYDLASAIGKDFEHLIELYGTESVTVLMPKVISSLEMLEAFANRNEKENEEVITLSKTVDRLENDKKETKELRAKFEKELEHIEENYKCEIKELWDVVQNLQEENKKLSCTLENKDHSPTATVSEADLNLMLKLKDTVDKQRDQLRAIEKENEERVLEIDALQQSIEKINRINKELLRKNRAVQSQGRILVEEKAELIAQIQAKERWVDDLKDRLTDAERAKRDLEQSKAEETAELDRENTPRFTLAELREVLQEKNTLKAKVMELEEELEQIRPQINPNSLNSDREDDLPVQGPMPREPEEKLFPWRTRKDSGVRKLFSKLNLFSRGGHSARKLPMHGNSNDLSPTFELARSAACSSCESSVSSSEIAEAGLPSPHDPPSAGVARLELSMEDCLPGSNWNHLAQRGASEVHANFHAGSNPGHNLDLKTFSASQGHPHDNNNHSIASHNNRIMLSGNQHQSPIRNPQYQPFSTLQDQVTSDYESLAPGDYLPSLDSNKCDLYNPHNINPANHLQSENCSYIKNINNNDNINSTMSSDINYDSGGDTLSEVSSIGHFTDSSAGTIQAGNCVHAQGVAKASRSGLPVGDRRHSNDRDQVPSSEDESHFAPGVRGLGQSLGVEEHRVAFPLRDEPGRMERQPSLIRAKMSKFFNAVSVAMEPPVTQSEECPLRRVNSDVEEQRDYKLEKPTQEGAYYDF